MKFIDFIIKNWAICLTIIIASFLIYRTFIKASLVRTDNLMLYERPDATHIITTETVNVRLETKDAFIPYEDIKVYFEITVVKPGLADNYIKTVFPFIKMIGAEYVDTKENKINKAFADGFLPSDAPQYLKDMNKNNTVFKITRIANTNRFEASGVVSYSNSGKYTVALIYQNGTSNSFMTIDIDGSSADAMNKRTNLILLIIGIITLALAIYSEFFKRK